MSKLNFFILIFSIILIQNHCYAAPNPIKFGSTGSGLGLGNGDGFGDDCRTEASTSLQKCIENYNESPDMFFRRLNSGASKDTCCKFYKIRTCIKKSLDDSNCRDIVDAVVASRLKPRLCDDYIEEDCNLQ